jgi:hypothetical protein
VPPLAPHPQEPPPLAHAPPSESADAAVRGRPHRARTQRRRSRPEGPCRVIALCDRPAARRRRRALCRRPLGRRGARVRAVRPRSRGRREAGLVGDRGGGRGDRGGGGGGGGYGLGGGQAGDGGGAVAEDAAGAGGAAAEALADAEEPEGLDGGRRAGDRDEVLPAVRGRLAGASGARRAREQNRLVMPRWFRDFSPLNLGGPGPGGPRNGLQKAA